MMPTDDWQFWVVTAVALVALLWIVRSLVRVLMPRHGRRGASRRTKLTVGGKPIERQ